MQGDPRNFGILAHWDGFQPTRTTYKNCWTLEITILNSGKTSSIGPLPVIFIPLSSTKLYKSTEFHVMNYFLTPFIDEMEKAYIEGFQVQYPYDPRKIHESLIQSQPRYLFHILNVFFILLICA